MKKLNKRGKLVMNISGWLGAFLVIAGVGSLDAGTMSLAKSILMEIVGMGLLFLASALYSVQFEDNY